jgi:hypothetical protein
LFDEESSMHVVNCIYEGENMIRGIFDRSTCRAKCEFGRTSKMRIAVRGHDLEDTVVDGENGHVERATTEVKDEDVLLSLLVEAVGDGSSGWLVDDASDIQARNSPRVLRCLTLSVVEVS